MDIADQLLSIMRDCLFTTEEAKSPDFDIAKAVKVRGLTRIYGFHPGRLASHKEEVITILREMPRQFFKDGGGGWSGLNLCMTKDDEQWGEQEDVDRLISLAIGMKLGSYVLPPKIWSVFPGCMPYVVFEALPTSPEKPKNCADSSEVKV